MTHVLIWRIHENPGMKEIDRRKFDPASYCKLPWWDSLMPMIQIWSHTIFRQVGKELYWKRTVQKAGYKMWICEKTIYVKLYEKNSAKSQDQYWNYAVLAIELLVCVANKINWKKIYGIKLILYLIISNWFCILIITMQSVIKFVIDQLFNLWRHWSITLISRWRLWCDWSIDCCLGDGLKVLN